MRRRAPAAVPSTRENPLLVGVDGGATEVKAHEVVQLEADDEGCVRLDVGHAAAFQCPSRARFVPIALSVQMHAHEEALSCSSDTVVTTREELAEAELWVECAAQAILSVAAVRNTARIVIGMCMPGLKTSDSRGITVMKNGPRIPDYLDRLETRLLREGLRLEGSIAGLVSDGFACGLGEQAAHDGALRDVNDAYYIGGGTGLAECFVIEGEVLALDAFELRLKKAWQMESPRGGTFEALLSMRGMNERCAGGGFVEQLALAGDREARIVLLDAAEALADLIDERVHAVKSRGRGTLERVVVGQRLGAVLADPAMRAVLAEPVQRALERRLGADRARGFLVASTLRAAPAIGAAAFALSKMQEEAHG
jgi:hypothetical protein